MSFEKLYPFQKNVIDYMLKHNYVLNALEVGLGKSVCALAVTVKENLKTLIICPAYLKRTWQDEIYKWCPNHEHLFTIISYGSLHKLKGTFECLILDEAHAIKNPKAKRTKFILKYVEDTRPKRVMALSGTFVKNFIGDLFTLLAICGLSPIENNGRNILDKFTDPWKFNRYFSNEYKVDYGSRTVTKFEGVRNLDTLKLYLQDKYIRLKASDVLDLPKQVYKYVFIPEEKYSNDLQLAYEEYEQGKNSTHIMTVKKLSAMVKVPTTVEHAKELLNQVDKIVIFSDHVAPVRKIASELEKNYNVAVITGSVDTALRGEIVKNFQVGDLQVIVATIGAASTGLTLTATHHMLFNDYSWSATDIMQTEGRIHRISQNNTCFYHVVVTGGIDRNIFKTVINKRKLIKVV